MHADMRVSRLGFAQDCASAYAAAIAPACREGVVMAGGTYLDRRHSMIFEFTDSEVAQCIWDDGRLQLRFSAARLLDADDPRADAVWAPVLLTAEQVEPWEALEPAACMGRIRQGFVLHASQRIQKLPMPCELQGVVTMELEFAQGGVVHVRCHSLSLHPLQGTAVGSYQC